MSSGQNTYHHTSIPDSHVMGFLGGLLWAVGTVSSLVSGQSIGMALSYSIGQRYL